MKSMQPITVRVVFVLAVVALNVTPGGAALTDDLQAYWPLDGNPDDQVGGVNLDLLGNADFVATGIVGLAGTSGPEQQSGDHSAFHSSTPIGTSFGISDEMTISSWYRIDAVHGSGEKSSMRQLNGVFGFYNPDNNTNYNHFLKWNGGGAINRSLSLPTTIGQWFHVVQRVDAAGNLSFWHEDAASADHGVSVDSVELNAYTNVDTSLLTGGAAFLTAYYETKNGTTGQVSSDEVAIWNRALADAEIEELFDNGKAGVSIFGDPPPPPTSFTWAASGLGNWNSNPNWNSSGSPNGRGHTAVFSSSITQDSTVVVDTPVTVNRIQFDNATNRYAIGGLASVSLTANTESPPVNPSIVVQGTHEFQTIVSLHNNTTVDVASDSTLEFNHRLFLNSNTLTKTGEGNMAISNHVVAGGGNVNCAEGTCSGTGAIGGNLNNTGGTVSPGNSPGISSPGISVVPEPTSIALLVLGFAGLISYGRRSRSLPI